MDALEKFRRLNNDENIPSKDNTVVPTHNIKGTSNACSGTGKVPVVGLEDTDENIRRCINFSACKTKFRWRPNRDTLGGSWSKSKK